MRNRLLLALIGTLMCLGMGIAPANAAQTSSSCTVTWRSCTSSAVAAGSHDALEVYVEGSLLCTTTYTIRDVRNGVVVSKGSVRPLGSTRFLLVKVYSDYTIRLDAACGGATGLLRSY